MKWLMHPLLTLIAGATDSELAKYVEYLKAENKILRARLPNKIDTTEAERDRLLKVGKPLGSKIKDLVTIVSPRTFQRWVQASENETKTSTEAKTAAQGNSKPQEIHNLVLKIRRETGWGAGRIKGELYRLGYKNIGRTTINRILRENGFKSEPLETLSIADLQLPESLGGTLKWYETKAA